MIPNHEGAIRRRLEADPAIRRLLQDLHQDVLEDRARRAKASPKAHKLTKTFDGPLRWRYYSAGRDRRDRKVSFCYTTVRNAAGYYLGWREVEGANGGKRDQWTASKTRRVVAERAKQRRDAFVARRAS